MAPPPPTNGSKLTAGRAAAAAAAASSSTAGTTTTLESSPDDDDDDGLLRYHRGFNNNFESESIPGTLPLGRNNPRRVPGRLYSEQLSGTAFTSPR
eukprot:CAMPEP_0113598942 /NCGR_PEP_ID=MMETSP0015_2-20120614/41868_1 /TAXON_ID=2838 /ORGANISM="Odontella" /LENGTH=95 /DNA_ID=CAMNT_0000507017 /DNA_START=635 /DNA_END=918 /DNA_ORIENTATION=+ /assembly_acc=CAM_ASM_000160